MKTRNRPQGSYYPEVLQMDVVLIHWVSGLLLTAKSSKNNKLEIQHDNNNMQSQFAAKGKRQTVREESKKKC